MRRSRSRKRGSSSGRGRLYLGIALGILLSAVVTVVPGIVVADVAHVEDLVAPSATNQIHRGETLYLESKEAGYLNRIFKERSHEIAFCGLIDEDNKPRIEVWLADTLNAGPDSVEFLTNNCPPRTEALLHTHPNGVLQLSEADKQTLQQQPEEVMCVQGGQLNTDPGTELENIACYRQLQPDQPQLMMERLTVVAMEDEPTLSE